MTTLYVYELETGKVVARITGNNGNSNLEQYADENYGLDHYGWTYSPAFGCVDGLVDTDDADVVDLEEVR